MAEPSSDIVSLVKNLLIDNWNIVNCPIPKITEQWSTKREDLSGDGLVTIYESASLHKARGDVQWMCRDWDGHVSIDIRTTISSSKLQSLYSEIDRILTSKRTTLGGGWHKIEEVDRIPMNHYSVGLYRYVVEVALIARKKIIEE